LIEEGRLGKGKGKRAVRSISRRVHETEVGSAGILGMASWYLS